MPGKGRVAEPGFVVTAPGSDVIMIPPVSVCHQVSTIGPLLLADHVVIPHPRFGIDRFAHGSEQPQGTHVVAVRVFVTEADERTNRSGRRIEDVHAPLFDQ